MDRYTRIYTGVQLVLLLGEVGGNRMIELNLENKKGKIKINSSDVKNILRLRPDFEYIQDISETIKGFQSGKVQQYAIYFLVGIIGLALLFIYFWK